MVVKTSSTLEVLVLSPKDLELVGELHRFNLWCQLLNIAVAKLIYTPQALMQVLQLLKRESSIKMEKLATDNMSKENFLEKVVLQNAMNSFNVTTKL
jgi:hypothetical protein